MKKYNLRVLTSYSHYDVTVRAKQMSYGNHGSYLFWDGHELIASYPIERTIIRSIEADDTTIEITNN